MVLACVLLGMFDLEAGAAFMEPTPDQIVAAVKNPSEIARLLNGATPENAVGVLLAAIDGVVQLKLPEVQQKTRIAQLVAIVFETMPDRAVDLAQLLAQKASMDVLPTIVAAAAIVMGNQAAVVTDAFVTNVARENAQLLRNAGTHPETVLPVGVVLTLGVAVSHTTTAVGSQPTAMPLAPPLTEHAGHSVTASAPSPVPTPMPPQPSPPPRPPVATNYAGQ